MKTSAVEMNLKPQQGASSLPVSSSPEIKTFNVQLIFRDIFSANEMSFCDVTWEKFFLSVSNYETVVGFRT